MKRRRMVIALAALLISLAALQSAIAETDATGTIDVHFEYQHELLLLSMSVHAGNVAVTANNREVQTAGMENTPNGMVIVIPLSELPSDESVNYIIELFSDQGEHIQTVEILSTAPKDTADESPGVPDEPANPVELGETDAVDYHFELQDNAILLFVGAHAGNASVLANGNEVQTAGMEPTPSGIVIVFARDVLPVNEPMDFTIELFSDQGEHLRTVSFSGAVPEGGEPAQAAETDTAAPDAPAEAVEADASDSVQFQFDENCVVLHIGMYADTAAVTVNGVAIQPEMEYASGGMTLIFPQSFCPPNVPNDFTIELLSGQGERIQTIELNGLIYNYHAELDIGNLSAYTQAQYVYLYGPEGIGGDLSALSGFRDLKTLYLYDCQFITGDLAALKDLTQLRELVLFNCCALEGRLESLSGLEKLQTLSIYHMGGVHGSLHDVSGLPELRSLAVNECEDVTGTTQDIQAMNSLEAVSFVSEGLVGNISALAGKAGMKAILLGSPYLFGDIGSLPEMPFLKVLSLDGEYITGDIGALSGLSGLRYLNLECDRLYGDIGALAGLENLRDLMVFQCPWVTGMVTLVSGELVDTGLAPGSAAEIASIRPAHVLLDNAEITNDPDYRQLKRIPADIAWGPDGCLYVTDWKNMDIVRVDGEGNSQALNLWGIFPIIPRCVAFDPDGNLYVTDQNYIFCLDSGGRFDALPDIQAFLIGDIAVAPSGTLFYTDRWEGRLYQWTPEGGSEMIAEGLDNPQYLAAGPDGAVYISLMESPGILKADAETGEVHTFIQNEESNVSLAVDPQGDLWARSQDSLCQYTPEGNEIPVAVVRSSDHYDNWYHTSGGIVFDDAGMLWVTGDDLLIVPLDPAVLETATSSGFTTVSGQKTL